MGYKFDGLGISVGHAETGRMPEGESNRADSLAEYPLTHIEDNVPILPMPSGAPTSLPAQGHQAGHHAQPTPNDARYTQILDDLIDMGAALARRVHETAMAETTPASTVADATIAFDRISRCVRRTVALARHIAATPASGKQANARTQARTQIIRRVEDAIVTHARVERAATGQTDSLRAELAERLDDPALEFDLEGRPVDEIIAEICQDLGVARQGRSYVYQRRTPADVQALRNKAVAQPRPRLGARPGAASIENPLPPACPGPPIPTAQDDNPPLVPERGFPRAGSGDEAAQGSVGVSRWKSCGGGSAPS